MVAKDGVRRRLRAGAAALLLLLAAAAPAWALEALNLDLSQQHPLHLEGAAEVWLDTDGEATADQIATRTSIGWATAQVGAIYRLKSGQALWFRFALRAPAEPERWYLALPYPHVDRVSLYAPDATGQRVPQVAGDRVAVARWPVPHRYPLLPLVLGEGEARTFLLKVENPHGFSAPLRLVSESRLSRIEQRHSLVQGMYFGLAALVAALALVAAATLREAAYGYYAAAVALLALGQASQTGIAGLHLWPGQARWNDISVTALSVLAVGALLWFFDSVVSMAERSARLHRLLAVLALAGVAVALLIASPLPDAAQRVRLETAYIGTACVAGLLALAWAARHGDRYAWWILLATLPAVAAGALALGRSWGLVPIGFWTQHGMQVAAAIELPVLLVVLTLRSQQRREHQRRMAGLDRLDPATGLINGHVFTLRLQRMIARARRLQHQGVVLLVDIANIEQLRRDFDRRSADEMPLRVAGRLLAASREIDSVARLSELRFGILMEGPLTEAEATAAGPRLVARCLMPFDNRSVDWVAQVRVAQTVVPQEGRDAASVIECLEAMLAAVPPDSKRAVFTLSPR